MELPAYEHQPRETGAADTVRRFIAISDANEWPSGLTMEYAIGALERELARKSRPRAATRQARSEGRAFMPVMPALLLHPTPVREDDALLRVLEASIETLKAENEILRRCLAAAEARSAREVAKADGAIAELRALMRLRTWAAALRRRPAATRWRAARARPWWRGGLGGANGGVDSSPVGEVVSSPVDSSHCSSHRAVRGSSQHAQLPSRRAEGSLQRACR